jgi:hypothetical protein
MKPEDLIKLEYKLRVYRTKMVEARDAYLEICDLVKDTNITKKELLKVISETGLQHGASMTEAYRIWNIVHPEDRKAEVES